MIRKTIIILSATLAGASLLLGGASHWLDLVWEYSPSQHHRLRFSAFSSAIHITFTTSNDARLIARLEEAYADQQRWKKSESYKLKRCARSMTSFLDTFQFERQAFNMTLAGSVSSIPGTETYLSFSTRVPVFLFSLYPALAFLHHSVRRYRRWKHTLCMQCGYCLTGNVSGICPECGKQVEKPKHSPLRPLLATAAALVLLLTLGQFASHQRWWSRWVSGESLQVFRFLDGPAVSSMLSSCFSGDFQLIPADLKDGLKRSFPRHRFTVARIILGVHSSSSVNLIVITDLNTGAVVAHVWEPQLSPPSASFRTCLSGYACIDENDAIRRVRHLATLLLLSVSFGPDSQTTHLGEVLCDGDTVRAEIFITHNAFPKPRNEKPYLYLVAGIDDRFQLGDMRLVYPGAP